MADHWLAGGGGYAFMNPVLISHHGSQADLILSYGGPSIAWEPVWGRAFPCLGLLTGLGNFSVRTASGSNLNQESALFFALEPSVGCCFLFPTYAHVDLTLSARVFTGGQAGGQSATSFNGAQLGLAIIFGPLGLKR